MSFALKFYEWYKKRPNKVFILGETLTYEQVAREVVSVASAISPGDTVVHFEFNSPKSVIHYLASFWAGAKMVAVDPLTSAEDLRFILEDSEPDLVFADEETSTREKEVLKGYKLWSDEMKKEVFNKPYEYMDNEAGLVYYYAGIAGRTMQVLHSATRVGLNASALYTAIGLKGVSAILTVPVAHVLGNSVLGEVIEDGGSIYVMRKFNAKEAIEAINKYSINFLATVPMVYDALINEQGKLDSLEVCISTAAPLFPSTVNGFKQKFDKTIVQQYGFTEGLVVTYQPKDMGDVISIGKPLPNVEIKVVKDDGKEAKTGEVGELWVKAPWLMLGYEDKEETAKVFHDGWLKTGDLVSADERGLLYFKGVKKRMIKYKGYPIFPRDLEVILKGHPLVVDAYVFGEDAGNAGAQPSAKVVVKEKKQGLEKELLNYVNSKVAFYKRLKRVYIVDKIE
ncbi:MAG: acyl--CoA ligase [Candidatus Aramenus sp.]|jgi:long-chain acyl-CoA synthetase|nr:acyl--CoA ligase [Candidatus Aramenus sp.]